eukprot:3871390-Amphidinium_carterae.1
MSRVVSATGFLTPLGVVRYIRMPVRCDRPRKYWSIGDGGVDLWSICSKARLRSNAKLQTISGDSMSTRVLGMHCWRKPVRSVGGCLRALCRKQRTRSRAEDQNWQIARVIFVIFLVPLILLDVNTKGFVPPGTVFGRRGIEGVWGGTECPKYFLLWSVATAQVIHHWAPCGRTVS